MQEECGLCDGTGEECESRGIPQKCSACKGSGVLDSDAGMRCRCQDRAYTSYWAERSDIQGEKIAMYRAEY